MKIGWLLASCNFYYLANARIGKDMEFSISDTNEG